MAREFYVERLGFSVVQEKERSIDLDAGAMSLRLTELTQAEFKESGGALTLRIQSISVDTLLQRLADSGEVGVRLLGRGSEGDYAVEVSDPDGHRLVFWRVLSEDEYEHAPELPTTRSWDDEARDLMQDFLQGVPALFRDLARSGAVAEAEYLAADADAVRVENVVRAYIRAMPRMFRSRARQPLLDRGFDPDLYRADFLV